MGYAFDRDDLNKKDEWNGKIYSGDLAKRDNEGYYYKNRAEYYLECDQFYISPWLVPSIYESSVRITPDMFLFKLEEI